MTTKTTDTKRGRELVTFILDRLGACPLSAIGREGLGAHIHDELDEARDLGLVDYGSASSAEPERWDWTLGPVDLLVMSGATPAAEREALRLVREWAVAVRDHGAGADAWRLAEPPDWPDAIRSTEHDSAPSEATRVELGKPTGPTIELIGTRGRTRIAVQ